MKSLTLSALLLSLSLPAFAYDEMALYNALLGQQLRAEAQANYNALLQAHRDVRIQNQLNEIRRESRRSLDIDNSRREDAMLMD